MNLSDIVSSDYKTYLNQTKGSRDFGGFMDNLLTKWSQSGLTDADREANAWSAYREDLQFARETTLANTAYQRKVADMKAAGLNPMMAASGEGAVVPSMSPSGSVAPSGGLNLSDIMSLVMTGSQIKNLAADTALKKASASKAAAEASEIAERERGARIVNDINEASKDAQIESKNLEPAIKKLGNDKIRQEMKESEGRVKVLAEQEHSEAAKANYYDASAMLQKVNAYNAFVMLPYQQALAAAQTDEAKAAAALSGVHAAYQQGLLDSGYIDSLARDIAAKAGVSENEETLSDISTALRTGKYGKLEEQGIMKSSGSWIDGRLQAITVFLDNLNPLNGLLGK